jgi:hypothetical protein
MAIILSLGLTVVAAGSGGSSTGVVLEAFLKAFPDSRTIGVLYSEPQFEGAITELKAKAQERGIEVMPVKIGSIKEFPDQLQNMKGKADTLWVVDDPLYSLQEVWNFFIMFTLRNKIKTVVFTERALQYGGLFYFSPAQESMINKRILEAMGLTVSPEAGTVLYHGSGGS